ncbi:hypothetical protein LINPERHAP2_LOCUS32691, partial [Linum perenne]
MKSSQMSETCNSNLRKVLDSTMNLASFFTQYNRLVENKREEDRRQEFTMKDRQPDVRSKIALLEKISWLYTPEIFAMVQDECIASSPYVIGRDEVNDNEMGMAFKIYKWGCDNT